MSSPRIALIHATPLAIAPALAAFEFHWPEARPTSLLDEALQADRNDSDYAGPGFTNRLAVLAEYAVGIGARGLLFTCSAFADEIAAVAKALSIPVLRPDEAVLEAALERGDDICVLATFAPTIPVLEAQIELLREQTGFGGEVGFKLVENALEAMQRGDGEAHDRLIADAAAQVEAPTVVLGQYSMTRAADLVEERIGRAPMVGPVQAVLKMRGLVEATG